MIYEIRNNELVSSVEINLLFENVYFDKYNEKRQRMTPEFSKNRTISKKMFDSYKTHDISSLF